MPQFLLKPEALIEKPDPQGLKGAHFRLTGPDAFHIAKVLRQRAGEELELFDGHGGRFHGTMLRNFVFFLCFFVGQFLRLLSLG